MHPSDLPAMQRAFELQRASYDAAPFADWPTRRDRLQRLQRLVSANEREIEAAIDTDFGGRPRMETQLAEIFPTLGEIRSALKHGERWMQPRRAAVGKWFMPAGAFVQPRPLGVIGIIAAWNYPLFVAAGPLVGALVAGNRAMIKMSEFTPAFSRLFADLVRHDFAPEEVTVVNGDAELAAGFAALPFDHLIFTGSTAVGRKVMAAAAPNLTPVTLELGGKSPAIVTPGYDVDRAAARILAGKLLNAGQTCIAPDYVLVSATDRERLLIALQAHARRMYPRGLAERDYCSVVNPRHYGRLAGYLDQAAASGVAARPLFDGPQRDEGGHRLAPVALIDPPRTLDVMRNEIFGPILPVIGYESTDGTADAALAAVNAQPRPLALYWFDDDHARTERMLQQVHAGGVTINDTLLHIAQDSLPFGGVGASGIGHYHGRWGFDSLSKLTPVFRQSRLNGMKLFTPPYHPLAQRLLGLMKRF